MPQNSSRIGRRLRIAVCAAGFLFAPTLAAEPQASSYGPVRSGETLWGIASKLQPQFPSATIAQMAYALQRANPAAFSPADGSLQLGVTLEVPDVDFIEATSAAQSKRIVIGGEAPPPPAPLAVTAEAEALAVEAVMAPVLAAEAVSSVSNVFADTAEAADPALAPSTTRFKDSAEGQALLARSAPLPPAQLYAQLLPLEERFAGDVDYDYALGSAALDSGDASMAVFALQRAVSSAPNFSGARLELARAYYDIGDNESARREFSLLRRQNPPPQVEKAIVDYLRAIDRRAAAYRPQSQLFAEVSGGYDSNANAATDVATFLGFALNNRNLEQDSAYSGLGIGYSRSEPLRPGLRLIGDVGGLYKAYPDATFVNTTLGRLSAGVEGQLGVWTVGGQFGGQLLMLDGESNHNNLGLEFSSSRAAGEFWRVGASLRQGWQRFADGLEVQDVNQTYLGVYGQGRVESLPRLQLTLAATTGKDRAQQANSPFGRQLSGLRANAGWILGPNTTLLFSVAAVQSDYDGLFFGQVREDRQTSASLGLDWRGLAAQGWNVRAQLASTQQDSDLSLYEYDRVDAGVNLRKEFK